MKKKNIVYSNILDIDRIIDTYHNIMINTKHRNKILEYNMFYMCNLVTIYNKLKNHTYHHGEYNIFVIKEPKVRVIMSEKLEDKIVNHLVSDYILLPLIEPRLIDTNVATRVGKGTKMVIYYMKKYLITMHKKYSNFYILKCDISKFFYSIDHDVLLNKLKKIGLDNDSYEIIEDIIHSTDYKYIYDKIDNFGVTTNYKKGKGLGIGNQTSQILAIFYLNDLDHFIKEKLHIKYYIRYMDDFILIHQDKEYLKYCLEEIKKFLKFDKLELNHKTNIYSICNGVSFIGYKYIFKKNRLYMLIPSNTKKRIKKRIREKKTTIENYNGYLIFGNTSKFKKSMEFI